MFMTCNLISLFSSNCKIVFDLIQTTRIYDCMTLCDEVLYLRNSNVEVLTVDLHVLKIKDAFYVNCFIKSQLNLFCSQINKDNFTN